MNQRSSLLRPRVQFTAIEGTRVVRRTHADYTRTMTGRPEPAWWTGGRGEWWVVGQCVLLALALALPPSGPWPDGMRVIALPLTLVGGTLVGLGAAALGPSLTILPRPRAHLVRRGIYRAMRHPIYAGVILLALAWAFWRASVLHTGIAGAIAVFFAAKARREERYLAERFPDYADYRRRVPAFIPRIRRR